MTSHLYLLILSGHTVVMDSKDKRSGTVVAPVAFFSRTFDEALALTREARDYLRDYGEDDSRDLALEIATHFSVETMRLTSRLTNMMAWLLVQRAVHQGELSREEVREDNWRLGGAAVCLDEGELDPDLLPPYLSDLLRRSERLYRRIARLDSMVANEAV
jgi:regulator of CtrA degradation